MKAELTGKYVSRLPNQMQNWQRHGDATVEGDIQEVPLLDFEAGYVLRSKDQFPKQGDACRGRMTKITLKILLA